MDLEFNVAQLMQDPVGAHRSYDFNEPELLLSEAIHEDDDELIARNISGHVKLTQLHRRLRVEGTVQAEVALRCSRCLDLFTATVHAPIDELFLQTHDVTSGLPVALPEGEDPDVLVIDRNHLVNLVEPIRQTLLVNLPLQPVCREDCAGLCLHCGKNLNEGPCDCPTETVDPRMAVLADLLKDERTAERFSIN